MKRNDEPRGTQNDGATTAARADTSLFAAAARSRGAYRVDREERRRGPRAPRVCRWLPACFGYRTCWTGGVAARANRRVQPQMDALKKQLATTSAATPQRRASLSGDTVGVFTRWLPVVATHHLIPTAAQQVGRCSLGRGGRGWDWRRDVIPDFRYFRAAGAGAVPCGLLY